MLWAGKEIVDLTDGELFNAQQRLASMASTNELIKASPEFKERMGSRPFPITNPNFTQLVEAINTELDKRKSNG